MCNAGKTSVPDDYQEVGTPTPVAVSACGNDLGNKKMRCSHAKYGPGGRRVGDRRHVPLADDQPSMIRAHEEFGSNCLRWLGTDTPGRV